MKILDSQNNRKHLSGCFFKTRIRSISLVANYLSYLIHTMLAEQGYPLICSDLDTARLFSPEVIRYKHRELSVLLCRCSTTSESAYKQMAHIASSLIGFYSLHSDFLYAVSSVVKRMIPPQPLAITV